MKVARRCALRAPEVDLKCERILTAKVALDHGLPGLDGRGRDEDFSAPTGSPEAVARLQFPQNVACGFTALRSSAGGSQHWKSLQLRIWEAQLWFQ
jgi:hypothetical protein